MKRRYNSGKCAALKNISYLHFFITMIAISIHVLNAVNEVNNSFYLLFKIESTIYYIDNRKWMPLIQFHLICVLWIGLHSSVVIRLKKVKILSICDELCKLDLVLQFNNFEIALDFCCWLGGWFCFEICRLVTIINLPILCIQSPLFQIYSTTNENKF